MPNLASNRSINSSAEKKIKVTTNSMGIKHASMRLDSAAFTSNGNHQTSYGRLPGDVGDVRTKTLYIERGSSLNERVRI